MITSGKPVQKLAAGLLPDGRPWLLYWYCDRWAALKPEYKTPFIDHHTPTDVVLKWRIDQGEIVG